MIDFFNLLTSIVVALQITKKIKKASICSDPQNIDFSNLYFGGLFLWSNIP